MYWKQIDSFECDANCLRMRRALEAPRCCAARDAAVCSDHEQRRRLAVDSQMQAQMQLYVIVSDRVLLCTELVQVHTLLGRIMVQCNYRDACITPVPERIMPVPDLARG
jgi:hypothetical protein